MGKPTRRIEDSLAAAWGMMLQFHWYPSCGPLIVLFIEPQTSFMKPMSYNLINWAVVLLRYGWFIYRAVGFRFESIPAAVKSLLLLKFRKNAGEIRTKLLTQLQSHWKTNCRHKQSEMKRKHEGGEGVGGWGWGCSQKCGKSRKCICGYHLPPQSSPHPRCHAPFGRFSTSLGI